MPIYEYQCKDCGHRFDELRSYDEPDPSCPKCESLKTAKLVSRTSFSLKGGGWYKDHYGLKPSPKKDASNES